MSTAPLLEKEVHEADSQAATALILDLSDLDFMDSSGLGLIFGTHVRMKERGKRLLLVPGPERVQRLFDMTRLTPELDFLDKGERLS